MSREIKFRAWDKKKGVMIYSDSKDDQFIISLDGSIQGYDDDDGGKSGMWEHCYKVDVILLQFTGLFDKNGKEIWEGDIVNWTGIIFEIVWDFSNWVFKRIKGAYSYPIFHNSACKSEVIGNIYSNPELLEKD